MKLRSGRVLLPAEPKRRPSGRAGSVISGPVTKKRKLGQVNDIGIQQIFRLTPMMPNTQEQGQYNNLNLNLDSVKINVQQTDGQNDDAGGPQENQMEINVLNTNQDFKLRITTKIEIDDLPTQLMETKSEPVSDDEIIEINVADDAETPQNTP